MRFLQRWRRLLSCPTERKWVTVKFPFLSVSTADNCRDDEWFWKLKLQILVNIINRWIRWKIFDFIIEISYLFFFFAIDSGEKRDENVILFWHLKLTKLSSYNRNFISKGWAYSSTMKFMHSCNSCCYYTSLMVVHGSLSFWICCIGLWITTECGRLQVSPGEIVVLPQGFRFAVDLPDGPSRGYVAEIFGTHFQLPDLGPIGIQHFM